MAKYIYCSYCNTKNKVTNSRCENCGVGLYANISSQNSKFEQLNSNQRKPITKTPLKKYTDIIFGILLSGISFLLFMAIFGAIISPLIEWNMFLSVSFMALSNLILAVCIFAFKVNLYGFCIFSVFCGGIAISCFCPHMRTITNPEAFYITLALAIISIIPFVIVNSKKYL